MSGIFGGGGSGQNTVQPVAAGLRIQTSAYGLCLPLVYGRTRVTGNLIWFGDFTPIPHTTTSSGGGKGGGAPSSSNTSFTYTTSFALALCEGTISQIYSGWRDKEQLTLAQINALFTTFLGTYPQTAWSYLTSKHPGQDLGYQGIAYLAAANCDLGSSESLKNHSFEIGGKFSGGAIGSNKTITFTTPTLGSAKTITVARVQVGGNPFGGVGNAGIGVGYLGQGGTVSNTGFGLGTNILGNVGLENILQMTKGDFAVGDIIQFASTGTLPSGLTAGINYTVINAGSPKIGTTAYLAVSNSITGVAIKLLSLGTGTLTAKKMTFSGVINSTAHGFANSALVNLSGSVSSPFKTQVDYYVVNTATNTFGLSSTPGGLAIAALTSGSGAAYTVSRGGNPRDIIVDLLTASYGARFPATKIGDLTVFASFCVANGIFISPALTDQSAAQQILTDLMQITNSGVFFSEGLLKIVPLSDSDASGNNANYYAPNTPLYSLTDDDFLTSNGDPIKMNRNSTADAFNQVQVEFLNSQNQYNIEISEARDQAAVDTFGLLTKDPITAHALTDAGTARIVSQMILQRALYIRNTFEFSLSWKYCLLEPTDIVTLNDDALGLDDYAVRIISIEENNDGQFDVIAEDYPAGVSHSAIYPSSAGLGWSVNYNAPPGHVSPPAFFEVPSTQSTTGLAIGVAVTGNDVNWGGYEVWSSYDGTTYKRIGRMEGGARYGLTTNSVTNASGQVQNVALTGNGGQLIAGSSTDANNLATLCLIEDEYLSYTGAALLSANNYGLTLSNRAQKQTVAASHGSGKKFIRIDSAVFIGDDLTLDYIGKLMHFKFLSFNRYQGALEALADVVDYQYTITGVMAKLPPSDVASLTVVSDAAGITFNWTDVTDGDRKDYELRKGATWATATSQGFFGGNNAKASPQVSGSSTWLVKARDFFNNYSTNPASVVLTVNAPVAPSVTASIIGAEYKLSWSVPTAQFAIDHYEIRTGATWAGGTYVGTTGGQVYQAPVTYSGAVNFLVAAVDSAGNIGAAGSANISIVVPTAPVVTSQVVDNNILLYWNDTHQTLPIKTWEVRKGATFAGATPIGTKNGLFTTVFETQAGTFIYWIAPIDSAGNYGTPSSISATMSQPPDYVLQSNFDSTLNGTLSNAIKDVYGVTMPMNITETFSAHFSTNSWATPQAQITAGYPILIEPSMSAGYYEEIKDYGVTFSTMKITLTPLVNVLAGTPVMTYTISTSPNGSTWTDFVGVTEVFGTSFRYVKVRAAVASSGGDDLVQLKALNIRLDVKLKNDAGNVAAVSTDNSAAITGAGVGGTTVLFNTAFIAITSITLSAQGTTAAYSPIYDFTGSTVNPIGFKVYLYNAAGTRVSGTVSWAAKGY